MIRTDDMKDGHPILWAEILYDILYIHATYIYLCKVYDHPVRLPKQRESRERTCRTESLWHCPCRFWWWGRVTANKCNKIQIQHQSAIKSNGARVSRLEPAFFPSFFPCTKLANQQEDPLR